MRWVHRFERPNGIPFKVDLRDRFRNYMIGFQEIGKNTDEIIEQFHDKLPAEYVQSVKEELSIE